MKGMGMTGMEMEGRGRAGIRKGRDGKGKRREGGKEGMEEWRN